VLDGRVLGFTTILALLTGIGFGLVPALRTTRLDLTTEFQGGSRSLGGGRSRLKQGLLVLQVAISFVLLVGAGLFMRTLRNLRTVDAGFNRHHLLLFSVDADAAGHRGAQVVQIHGGVLERIAALPGVQSVAFSGWPLLNNAGGWGRFFSVPGHGEGTVGVNTVSPDFFSTLEMPILSGRGFTPHDNTKAPAVVVVNETFARNYYGAENPVGQRFELDGARWEIVGVARDVKQRNLRETTAPLVFIPFLRQNFANAHYVLRTVGEPSAALIAAVRQAVGEVDRNLLVTGVRTQDEVVENNVLGGERFYSRLSLSLGGLALALACVGLYGLLSYLVSHRTGEIGVRMALGASPLRIVWLILRESLALVGVGIGLGVAAAIAAGRAIAAMLYALSPTDPWTYGIVALVLVGVALFACWLPARRAAKVDPMVALRCE
jgi:predicted permease